MSNESTPPAHEKGAPKSAVMSYAAISGSMTQMALQSSVMWAITKIREAQEQLPRKHRLNPDDPEHQPSYAASETIKLLILAEEALFCAARINQKANQHPEDHESLRSALEPLLQAAELSLEHEKQRQRDSELHFQRLHFGEAPQ